MPHLHLIFNQQRLLLVLFDCTPQTRNSSDNWYSSSFLGIRWCNFQLENCISLFGATAVSRTAVTACCWLFVITGEYLIAAHVEHKQQLSLNEQRRVAFCSQHLFCVIWGHCSCDRFPFSPLVTTRTNDHPEEKKDVKVKSVCRKMSQWRTKTYRNIHRFESDRIRLDWKILFGVVECLVFHV